MSDASLQITVGADVSQVVSGMQTFEGELQAAQQQLVLLDRAITNALSRGADTAQLEQSFDNVATKIRGMNEAAAQATSSSGIGGIPTQLQAIEGPAADVSSSMQRAGLSTSQMRVAFIDLGRIVTGQGFSLRSLASNFSLLGPVVTIAAAAIYGLVELLNKQTDAEKKASQEAQRLAEFLLNLKDAGDVSLSASGSEEGNIARVQALASAVRDSNSTYAERKNALDQLRETNKAYFGDLTLESDSLKTLTDRVKDYSQALVGEAVVKGQVEEIAKVSSELEVQAHKLDELRDARARAQQAFDQTSGGGAPSLLTGAPSGNFAANDPFQQKLEQANKDFKAQQVVVDKLTTSIGAYRGELNIAIEEQLKFKPLKGAPLPIDDLKSILPILEQVQKIYDDLAKPSREPLFKQENTAQQLGNPLSNVAQIFQDKIQEALTNGIVKGKDDPKIKAAYDALASALRAQLAAAQNPNLSSHVDYTLADPAQAEKSLDKYETEIEKAAGASNHELKIPAHLDLELQRQGVDAEDARKITQELEKDPSLAQFYQIAVPEVQVAIRRFLIEKSSAELLQKTIKDSLTGAAVAGFADIGKAVGDALTGGKNPLQAAIKDFTTVLGDGLIKIGEQMILASSIMQGLKTALGGLFTNPAAGILEGIAAVALGETVKNIGAHAFATGGIVTGPTLGLVGEAGPEVIFPLNQLNNFIKTNRPAPQTVVVQGRIRGADINISSARAARLQNMAS